MKLLKLSRILFLVLLISSCSQSKYFSNVANAPLLKEKGEYQIHGTSNFGISIDPVKSIDLQTAYALSDHFVVQWNSSFHQASAYEDTGLSEEYYDLDDPIHQILLWPLYIEGENTNQIQLYSESSIGYFYRWNTFIAEIHLGAGIGRNWVDPIESMDWDIVNFYKLSGQLDLGFRCKYFDAGIGLKESFVNLYSIKKMDDINSRHLDFYTTEPFIFIGVGQEEYAKVYCKLGVIYNEVPTGIMPLEWLSIGINWRFPRNRYF